MQDSPISHHMDKKKILIVEDEASLLNILMDTLITEGFDVHGEANGKDGLQRALTEQPDLILLDIMMPIMDGMAMLQELRKDTWGKDVPVMLLTNLSEAEKVAEATAHGVYDFLVKNDWPIEAIVACIQKKMHTI